MADPLIRMTGVQFAYPPGRQVLAGADLALLPGERLGLTGPNGCGKSTLLHLLVGLLRPDDGEVWAFGRCRRTEADFHEVRRRAGLVFQDADDQLFCPTVIEDVAFGPLNLGKSPDQARAVAAETLGLLGMADFAERVTYRLSGGEKRLISLAAVLAMKPDVLLLDEPTAALDEQSRRHLAAVLTDLPQAMILVSYERDFLLGQTTRMVRMDAGRLGPNGD